MKRRWKAVLSITLGSVLAALGLFYWRTSWTRVSEATLTLNETSINGAVYQKDRRYLVFIETAQTANRVFLITRSQKYAAVSDNCYSVIGNRLFQTSEQCESVLMVEGGYAEFDGSIEWTEHTATFFADKGLRLKVSNLPR